MMYSVRGISPGREILIATPDTGIPEYQFVETKKRVLPNSTLIRVLNLRTSCPIPQCRINGLYCFFIAFAAGSHSSILAPIAADELKTLAGVKHVPNARCTLRIT